MTGSIEKTNLTIGIVPLTDCAPIAVAVERGCFAKRGLDVATTQERSWAGIRDKVAYGVLDAAQMLATMPLLCTAGGGVPDCPMVAGVTLDLNGNAITLSTAVCEEATDRLGGPWDRPRTADALRACVEARRRDGRPKLTLGMVFPMSTHDIELRYWLAAGGIDPVDDVELRVVPPPSMVDELRAGRLDGFCVGEPWNSVAVAEGLGEVVVAKHELWSNGSEKVLGVTADWAEQHPGTHAALIESIVEACAWLDEPANRREACEILSRPQYVNVDAQLLERSMTGGFVAAMGDEPIESPDFHVFHRYQANLPWRSHALWLLSQMVRWGAIDGSTDLNAVADQTFLPGMYRDAAARLGCSAPTTDSKIEGTHDGLWSLPSDAGPVTMSADRWIDGRTFDPNAPLADLGAFARPRDALKLGG